MQFSRHFCRISGTPRDLACVEDHVLALKNVSKEPVSSMPMPPLPPPPPGVGKGPSPSSKVEAADF